MIYAPVIIPTLNRYEHLKKCIDSLRANTQARDTTIYISLDYPPAEKYKDGYIRVKNYLETGIEGFKEVYIFFQEKNLGPFGNSDFLRSEASKQYDRYIYTEDDNVFSKNFLEYMNVNLEKYKDDKQMHAVCGCTLAISWSEEDNCSVLTSDLLTGYGYGCWFDKREELLTFQKKDLQSLMVNNRIAKEFRKRNPFLFNEAVYAALGKHYCANREDGELCYVDIVECIYMQLLNKKVVVPVLSKVRNEGYDGSGIHCDDMANETKEASYAKEYATMRIDSSEHFDAESHIWKEISEKDSYALNHSMYISIKQKLKSNILWNILRIRYKRGRI